MHVTRAQEKNTIIQFKKINLKIKNVTVVINRECSSECDVIYRQVKNKLDSLKNII